LLQPAFSAGRIVVSSGTNKEPNDRLRAAKENSE